MRADGKSVCFIAQALDEIKHGVARRQREGLLAFHEKAFASRFTVNALGNADCIDEMADTKFSQNLPHRANLSLPAVNQDHIGPCWKTIAHFGISGFFRRAMFFDQP